MTQSEFSIISAGKTVQVFTTVNGVHGWYDARVLRKNLTTNTIRVALVSGQKRHETHTRVSTKV